MEQKYSWKKMPENYNASYYNEIDYNEGKKFTIIDNETGKEYIYPQIETRKDANGHVYDQRIVDSELWNEDFMKWAICTTEDFINYVGDKWYTPQVLDYIVDNFQFPNIFSNSLNNHLRENMTRNLWNKAFLKNKEVARYIPKDFMTSDMVRALTKFKNVSLYNVNFNFLTPELFEKIYFNCDNEHRLHMLPIEADYRPEPWENIQALITKKVAEDILSLDIRTIWIIPTQFISEEDANKAMDTNIMLLEYVPVQYQTQDYQKKLIDKNPSYISLINSIALTDEAIYCSSSFDADCSTNICPVRPADRTIYVYANSL